MHRRQGPAAGMKHRVTFADDYDRNQDVVKCKVKIYKVSTMQRCPYIHEMKERLLGEQISMEVQPKKIPTPPPLIMDQQHHQQPVSTVVKLNADGYGSHTSPTHHRADRTPLMPKDRDEDFHYVDSSVYSYNMHHQIPKNAKTSLFIIMSFVYAKLLVVICVAYVISDVVTHNIPLYYYEGFFTYLYGVSILFLLYVFCFLLQESNCCSGGNETPPVKNKQEKQVKCKQAKEKEKEKKKEEEKKKKEEEKKKKEEKDKQKKEKKEKEKDKDKDKDKDKKAKKQEKRERYPRKMRDIVQQRQPPQPLQSTTYRRNSEGVVDAGLAAVPVPVAEIGAQSDAPLGPQEQQQQPQPPTAPPQPAAQAPQTPTSAALCQDVEAGTAARARRKRKTTQNDQSYGSFFLRIGAIAFGLATMIYNGLEFGSFFEVPFTSPCYMILQGVNPVLQMIFTFMQMYFIFMNSRLNIHRFKVVARFGLMHVVATNLCVWIRTLVLEYIKEITVYHRKFNNSSSLVTVANTSPTMHPHHPELSRGVARLAESVRSHSLRNENTVMGTHMRMPDVITSTVAAATTTVPTTTSTLANLMRATSQSATSHLSSIATTIPTDPTTTTRRVFTTPTTIQTTLWKIFNKTTTTSTTMSTPSITTTTTASSTTSTTPSTTRLWQYVTAANAPIAPKIPPFNFGSYSNFDTNDVVNVVEDAGVQSALDQSFAAANGSEFISDIIPQAFRGIFNFTASNLTNSTSCGRINIMGSIVKDSAPYLYPFIVEYSLIGACVIYVMWKHIGRNPKYVSEEDLEHRLEVMLSRRAVAMAHAQQGRVDCVGASKGLFFGLLMLVGSLICLILFFVLVHQQDFNLLAIYLADVSHCVLMVLSIIAIIIGFIRVQSLKFKAEEQSDLNDILLRVSAFGLFLYAVFSIIAGHLDALIKKPNLLVMITGVLSVVQVVLQLLFIADVSRRRVHLPEHDRSKPGRQVVTFLLICNVTMWIIYTFELQKVEANPVQLDFYGFLAWAIVQRVTLPLCIFHRFHSAVTLAEIWKGSYKARLE